MEAFLNTYSILNIHTLHTLKAIYADNIQCTDPAHEIEGIDNLTAYATFGIGRQRPLDYHAEGHEVWAVARNQ